MTLNEILAMFEMIAKILGVIGAAFGGIWLLIRYILSEIKAGDKAVMNEVRRGYSKLDARLDAETKNRHAGEKLHREVMDKMKETHVRREDMIELKQGLNALTSNINSRMDNILNIIMRVNDNKQS